MENTSTPYNYSRFKPSFYDLENFPGPKPGEQFPSLILNDRKGNKVSIEDYKDKWIVVESGSVTCPQYVGNIDSMRNLQDKYPDVVFLVLYVREAHPGNKISSHKSYEEKCTSAALTEGYGEFRPVLVDTLEGPYHQKLGKLPNFVYILNPEQQIVFRSDWNVSNEIDRVLSKSDPKEIFLDDHFEPKLAHPLLAAKVLFNAGWIAFLDIVLGLPRLIIMHFKSKKIKRFS